MNPNSLVIPCGSIWPSAWSKPQMWVSNYLSYVSLELSIFTVFIILFFFYYLFAQVHKKPNLFFIETWTWCTFFWCCCYFNFSITQNYLLCDAIMSLAVLQEITSFRTVRMSGKLAFKVALKGILQFGLNRMALWLDGISIFRYYQF